MSSLIRPARKKDASAIIEIYRPAIENQSISFEYQVPSPAEMAARISETLVNYPWLVYEDEGKVIGYAYASLHRSRAAYLWSAEVSAYVAQGQQRKGIAASLYAQLFAVMTRQGLVNAYAGITLPNPASVAFHESMGFTLIGVYRGVGYKLGQWLDVGWWEKRLQEVNPPPAFIPYSKLKH